MILFGHPTGNPNSHHAALAHWEAGRLDAFCVPWFPEKWELKLLKAIPGLKKEAERLSRRRFEPLAQSPKVQGRWGEWGRMVRRKMGGGEELSYEANDWLMRTMAKECGRKSVTAVHSYEDCSLWQFEAAKRMGKACIYDMPIGYYGWWQRREAELAKKYRDWLPPEGFTSSQYVRPEQKRKEMELADVVITASSFAKDTIREFFDKEVKLARYGVNLPERMDRKPKRDGVFRVVYAGTASVRKGTPLLLETWKKLGWKDAELVLAGSWQLAKPMERHLPAGVRHAGQLAHAGLMDLFRECDWLILPSNFEGYGLVILEALAQGLPVLASKATGAADLPEAPAVQLFEPDHPAQLAEVMIQAKNNQGRDVSREARKIAEGCAWKNYRKRVSEAVVPFL
jgi:glycosyltransferase involved in cell wall biosynthesis